MAEFSRRRAGDVLASLAGEGIDAVLLFPGPNIGYFTGFRIEPSERLACAVLPRRGAPWFVVNQLEEELRGCPTWFKGRAVWREDEDPVALLAETLRARGLGSARLGVPEDAPWVWVSRLQSLLPGAELVDASTPLAYTRMVKTPSELDCMREACRITELALGKALGLLRTGVTEGEVDAAFASEARRLGGGRLFSEVLFGGNAALPHGSSGERRLRPGDCVLIDAGCTVGGYWSDITRTVFYGEPAEEHRTIYAAVLAANRAAFEAARPGATCGSVDAAARRVIEEAGYGPNFIHRLGHGLGIQIHEHPYIVGGNNMRLAPGMTFTDEPGVYIVGEVGVRVEDTLVLTDSEAESLTSFPRELEIYPIRG